MSIERLPQYQLDKIQQIGEVTRSVKVIEDTHAAGALDQTFLTAVKGGISGAYNELRSEGLGDVAEQVVFIARNERNYPSPRKA